MVPQLFQKLEHLINLAIANMRYAAKVHLHLLESLRDCFGENRKVLIIRRHFKVAELRLALYLGHMGVLLVVCIVFLLEELSKHQRVDNAVFVALGAKELGVAGPYALTELDGCLCGRISRP